MNKTKKFLSLVLVLIMCFSVVPMTDLGMKASAYSERTTAPSNDNAYYYNSSYNPLAAKYVGECTWYAFGRAYEILGYKPNLSTRNGNYWYSENISNGAFKYGSTPKVGSIMVTQKTSTSGHVAVVERLNSNGTMLISEYNWNVDHGFKTETLSQSATTRGKHTVLGYIYLIDDAGGGTPSTPSDPNSKIYFHWISNFDNSDAYIDISGTPTVSGEKKFWFKEIDEDTNYYINMYIDNTQVISHTSSDANGYVSYKLDTGTLTNGIHKIKAELVNTNGAYICEKSFNVNNLIRFHWISNTDNSDAGINTSGTPTISGEKKIWFQKISADTNYYINIYLDGQKVIDHGSTDASGYISYITNTDKLSNGSHTIQAVLVDTNSAYTATKTFIVNNPSYTVSFNANGGSCSTTSKTVKYSSTYGTLPTPTWNGHTFNGWYTSAKDGTKVTSSTTVTATSNHTLYAHWTCNHTSTEVRNAKSATCTTTGYTGDTYCKTCGTKIKTGTTIAKTAHSYSSSITTQPTCTNEGLKTYTCSCGASYTEVLAKTGHNSNITIRGKAATCTKYGLSDGKKCSVCGTVTVEQQRIEPGHKYVEIKAPVPPTCTTEGSLGEKKCSVCGDIEYIYIAIACKGHTEISIPAVSATCTKTGLTEGKKCSVCGTITVAQQTVAKIACADNNGDSKCDTCGTNLGTSTPTEPDTPDEPEKNCSCNCHKGGISGFFFKLINFFEKLFGKNKVCKCGVKH